MSELRGWIGESYLFASSEEIAEAIIEQASNDDRLVSKDDFTSKIQDMIAEAVGVPSDFLNPVYDADFAKCISTTSKRIFTKHVSKHTRPDWDIYTCQHDINNLPKEIIDILHERHSITLDTLIDKYGFHDPIDILKHHISYTNSVVNDYISDLNIRMYLDSVFDKYEIVYTPFHPTKWYFHGGEYNR